MSVDIVRGQLSQGMMGTEGSPSVWNSTMFTDLMKKVKSLTSSSPWLSQSAMSGHSIVLSQENAARGITHIAMGDSTNNVGMIPVSSLYGVNAVIGSVLAKQSYHRLERAEHIGWEREKLHAGIDLARGSIQTTLAASLVTSRVLSSVKVFLKKENPHFSNAMLSSVARVMHIVGNCFVGLLQLALVGSNAFSLRNVRNLSNKLSKEHGSTSIEGVEGALKVVEFISKRIDATPISTLTKLMEKHGGSVAKVKGHLSTIAEKTAKKCVASAAKEYQLNLSKKGAQELTTTLITEIDKSDLSLFIKESLKLTELEEKQSELVNQLSPSELWGLAIECQSRGIKKELKFSTATSSAALEIAKLGVTEDLSARLRSEDPFIVKGALKETEVLLTKVLGDLTQNQRIHGARIFVSIVNLIGSILSAIFTAGIGAIAAAGVFLASNVMSCGVDFAIVSKNLTDKGPVGKYDEWIAITAGALIVLSTVASIVLISLFSFGTVPLALVCVGGIIALINTCVIYKKIAEKRALLEKEKPTLESLKKRSLTLKKHSLLDEEMKALIQKLPKAERRALKIQVAEQAGCVAEGVKSLSQEDLLLDKDHDFAEKLFLQDPFTPTISKAAKKVWSRSKSEAIRGLYERLVSQGNVSREEVHEYFHLKLSTEEKRELLHSIYQSRAKKDFSWHFQKMDVTVGQLVSAIASLESSSISKKT